MEEKLEEKEGREPSPPAEGKLPRWLEMTVVVLKIGLFTFGGGWSIIAQLQMEFVEKRRWITETELLDIVALARSFPGIMIVNTSVMMGYSIGGVGYAILCGLAIAAPAFVVMMGVTLFYTAVRDNPYVSRAMIGVQAAVVPIIISAILNLRKTAIKDAAGLCVTAVAFLLFLFTDMNNIYIVLMGGVAGLAIQTLRLGRVAGKAGKGGEKDAPDAH